MQKSSLRFKVLFCCLTAGVILLQSESWLLDAAKLHTWIKTTPSFLAQQSLKDLESWRDFFIFLKA